MRKLVTLGFIGMFGLGLGGCASSKAGCEEVAAAPAPEAEAAVDAEATPAEETAAVEALTEEAPAEEAPAETAEVTE